MFPRPNSPIRNLGVAALALAISMSAVPTSAQQPDAKELFEQGTQAYQNGDYPTAVDRLQKSLALRDSWSVRFNLGLSYEKLGQNARALCHHERSLGLLAADDPDRAKTQESLARVKPRVGTLDILVPPQAGPDPVDITVDGQPPTTLSPCARQPAPHHWIVPVDPGPHSVEARNLLSRSSVTLAAGETRHVAVEPKAPPPPPPPPAPDWRWPAGFAVGGAGAVTLIGGIVLGGLALDRKAAADRACLGGCNSQAELSARDAALFGDTSTALFIGGATALGLGILLTVLGRPTPPKSALFGPVVSHGRAGAVLRAQF